MKTYGGDAFYQFTSIVKNKHGTLTIGGFTNSYGIFNSIYEPDFWFVKTNSKGDVLVNKTYGSV